MMVLGKYHDEVRFVDWCKYQLYVFIRFNNTLIKHKNELSFADLLLYSREKNAPPFWQIASYTDILQRK